ncbi:MAG: XdhC family protein [Pseudomonadota bacterium]
MDHSPAPLEVTIAYGPNRPAIEALQQENQGGVLAVITGTQGPSYRPIGAAMALFPNANHSVGSLSSGCVEGDLQHHAAASLYESKGRTVRYGTGSPFMDIQLPCGGALEITLVPEPSLALLKIIRSRLSARDTARFSVHPDGFIDATPQPGSVTINYEPDIHFTILGKGPEATMFAGLAVAAGYSAQLFSHDDETRNSAAASGCDVDKLVKDQFPKDAIADRNSAIILFFHDHDWEPALLAAAVKTEASYIGAQGSLRARALRDDALRNIGVPEEDIKSIYGPIGLVPSARDPQTLAVSVLAEALVAFKAPQ